MRERMLLTRLWNGGICSKFPKPVLDEITLWSTSIMHPNLVGAGNRLYIENWIACKNGEIPLQTGIDGCLLRMSELETDDGCLCYAWDVPRYNSPLLVPLLKSVMRLGLITRDRPHEGMFVSNVGPLDLGIEVDHVSNGFHVKADLGHEIWEAIRSPDFDGEILPELNAELKAWFGARYGRDVHGQYLIRRGDLVQFDVMPGASYESICGTEEIASGNCQFNSDSSGWEEAALGMIATMCMLHKHALALINSREVVAR